MINEWRLNEDWRKLVKSIKLIKIKWNNINNYKLEIDNLKLKLE